MERLRASAAGALPAGGGGEPAPSPDWRTCLVLLTTPLLLTLFYTYGQPDYFRLHHGAWAARVGAGQWFVGLLPYAWWSAVAVLLRVLVPLALVVLVMKHRPADYGFRLRGTLRYAPLCLAAAVAVLPLLLVASRQPGFLARYPLCGAAANGGWHLAVWELIYLVQLVALEAFFRGFLLFGLARTLGAVAVPVMVIPYCMIHFGKPLPETLASIPAGLLLGALALRCRSFVPGAAVHFAVALCMDVLALWRR